MPVKIRTRHINLAALSLLTFAATTQAQAIVLEHKWQAGQQLPYAMTLKGNLSGETNASWAGPLSGVPVDIAVDGNGRWILNTLSVDDKGNGTVQFQIPQLSVAANAWGMGATLKIEKGQATASLNGAPGKKFDVSKWTNSSNALVISRNAQVQSVAPAATKTSSTQTSSTRCDETTSTYAATSTATSSAAQNMNDLARLMPQWWPGRDISTGESWTIDATMPLGTEANAPQLSVGSFTLKLQNEEFLAGRTVQRVVVNGLIEISGEKAQAINAAAKMKNANAPRVISSTKNISGDILFDASLGQIARAAFKVVSKDELRGTTPASEKKAASNWTLKHGFNGNIGLQQQ